MKPRATSSSVLTRPRPAPTREERRQCVRTPVASLVCDAGGVIDLSVRGMRVRTEKPWREGQTRVLTLTDGPHSMSIEARCVWSIADSDRRHIVGLAFDRVEPQQEGMLLRFSMEHEAG